MEVGAGVGGDWDCARVFVLVGVGVGVCDIMEICARRANKHEGKRDNE